MSCWERKTSSIFLRVGLSQGFLSTLLHHHHHHHQPKYARIEMSHLNSGNGGEHRAVVVFLIPSLAELKALMNL